MTQERARQWPLGAIRVAVIVAGILIVAFGWFDMTRDMRNDERMERARLEAHALTQARAAGAKAWLTKPFNPPMLLDAVSRVLPN